MDTIFIPEYETTQSIDALHAREQELLEALVQFYGPLPVVYGEERTSGLYDEAHARLRELRTGCL